MTSELKKIANAYGFALQLALEDAVRSGTAWEVTSREHGWQDGHEPKFIDLMLSLHRKIHLVVECKRTQGGSWVFLVPDTGNARARF